MHRAGPGHLPSRAQAPKQKNIALTALTADVSFMPSSPMCARPPDSRDEQIGEASDQRRAVARVVRNNVGRISVAPADGVITARSNPGRGFGFPVPKGAAERSLYHSGGRSEPSPAHSAPAAVLALTCERQRNRGARAG